MIGNKAQLELALIKGFALALVVIVGFYAYEKISGETSNGDSIECIWKCESSSWTQCTNGYQYRYIGKCTSQSNCECVPNNPLCFESDAIPERKRVCQVD